MAATLIEQQRLLHQDIESHEVVLMKLLQEIPKTSKETIQQDHLIQAHIQAIVNDEKKLDQFYRDDDGIRRNEIAGITTQTIFTGFYERLRGIREYHVRFSESAAFSTYDATDPTLDPALDLRPEIHFTGEEMFGKYVDMHDLHERFVNMEQFSKVDYQTFLSTFYKFEEVPYEKKNQIYKQFLSDVLEYLCSFHSRIRPLYPVQRILDQIKSDFESRWANEEAPKAANAARSLALASLAPSSESKEDSMDSESKSDELKELDSNPLYCKACAKLFAKDTVYNAHLQGKKHLKNQSVLEAALKTKSAALAVVSSSSPVEQSALFVKKMEFWRDVALLEYQIENMALLLEDILHNTQLWIEAKQTKTWQEIEAEHEAEDRTVEEEESESDEEDKSVYNPLNLPLGFDGKPIPYWLYKLHGLNIEYKCEICGNYSYWGPRAYQRHFQEARHAYGMRCLGIPNTKQFMNVTSIDDAKALWAKIQGSTKEDSWKAEAQEEFEDSQGNVFPRKIYEDLKKQGLI